jgi:hypothetical protein
MAHSHAHDLTELKFEASCPPMTLLLAAATGAFSGKQTN